MTDRHDNPALVQAAQALLGRLRIWWQQGSEFDTIDSREIQRIGAELGMTVSDLRNLVARGPDGANLLYRRMKALGISRSDVERTAQGLMHDLERTCCCCDQKKKCTADLNANPEHSRWKEYCPNAISLQGAAGMRGRFPA